MKNIICKVDAFAILIIISLIMYWNMGNIPIHPDESHWIGLSAPFEAFIQGNFEHEYWKNLPAPYINPPMTYYVIGLTRNLGGYSADDLPPIYNFDLSYEENLARGRMPGQELLWWSRLGTTTGSILGLWVFFLILKKVQIAWVSYIWLVLILLTPYFRETLRQAMNEGPFLFFISLSVSMTLLVIQKAKSNSPNLISLNSISYLICAGLFAGLATQTKINGGILVIGIWGTLALYIMRQSIPMNKKIMGLILTGIIISSSSLIIYIGTNPVLWTDTMMGLIKVLNDRADVLELQTNMVNNSAMSSTLARIETVSNRILIDLAILPKVLPNGLFLLIGMVFMIKSTYRWWINKNSQHGLVTLLITGLTLSIPPLFSPLDWPRYFFLPAFFFGIYAVIGLVIFINYLYYSILSEEFWKKFQ